MYALCSTQHPRSMRKLNFISDVVLVISMAQSQKVVSPLSHYFDIFVLLEGKFQALSSADIKNITPTISTGNFQLEMRISKLLNNVTAGILTCIMLNYSWSHHIYGYVPTVHLDSPFKSTRL